MTHLQRTLKTKLPKNQASIFATDANIRTANLPENSGRNSQDQKVSKRNPKETTDFLAILEQRELSILNGKHSGDMQGKFTFESHSHNGRVTRSGIDLVATNPKGKEIVKKFVVGEQPIQAKEYTQDHRTLEITIAFPAEMN